MHYKRGRPKAKSRACSCGNKSLKRDGNTLASLDIVHNPGCASLPEESRAVAPGKFKKNTRKWCKGVVGREHDKVWLKNHSFSARLTCIVCWKEFDWCWHGWSRKKELCRCRLFNDEFFKVTDSQLLKAVGRR